MLVSRINMDSLPGGSLLTSWPEGFDEKGRNVLNDVGEFRLVEMWYSGGPRVVECRGDVQAAFDQALFCVSDARHGVTKPAERVKLSSVLYSLHNGVLNGKNSASFSYVFELTDLLGNMLVKAMRANDVEVGVNTLASTLKAALRCVAIASGRLPDKDGQKRKLKPEAVAILEGRKFFESTAHLPTKSAIRAAMEAQKIVFRGKNAESKWREVFFRARLHELPE
jgi:hypothetical protein